MIQPSQVVDLALSQDGDRYVFGKEVSKSDTNPSAFDCSELLEWIGGRLGIIPTIPDGSWFQVQHLRKHGGLRPVSFAIETKGALLFRFVGDPFGNTRPSQAHVAISQGNGMTIEARSTIYGVGQWTSSQASRKWTHGGLIPGVQYIPEAPINTAIPSPWAVDAMRKAIDKDIVRGSHPRSPVTTEQVMVWLDRLGLLE